MRLIPRSCLLRLAIVAGLLLLALLSLRPAASMVLPTPPAPYLPGAPMPPASYCEWWSSFESDDIWCTSRPDGNLEYRVSYRYSRSRRLVEKVSIWLDPALTVGTLFLALGAPECVEGSWGLNELHWVGQGISVWTFQDFSPASKVYFLSYYEGGVPDEGGLYGVPCVPWRGFTGYHNERED